MGCTDLQNLFWQFHVFLESEGSFQRLCFSLSIFMLYNGFLHFPIFFLHYRMPVMCLELQKIKHLRCLPLSSGTWSFYINLFFAESPVLFYDGKSMPFLLPLFLLQIQNNTENLYAGKQDFHILLYRPHCNHQGPRHWRVMTLCGVIFLPGPLSMKMKLSIFFPLCLHKRTVFTRTQYKPSRMWK